jgi:hypothetical protein
MPMLKYMTFFSNKYNEIKLYLCNKLDRKPTIKEVHKYIKPLWNEYKNNYIKVSSWLLKTAEAYKNIFKTTSN